MGMFGDNKKDDMYYELEEFLRDHSLRDLLEIIAFLVTDYHE